MIPPHPFTTTTILAGLLIGFSTICSAQNSPLDEAAKTIGKALARKRAIEDTEKDALAVKAPTGLLGAKWLMSVADVKKIRPKAVALNADVLAEEVEIYQRPAVVAYNFKDDSLLLVIVTFRKTSDKAFAAAQASLESDYGPMSAPAPSEEFRKDSEKRFDRFIVRHTILVHQDTSIEQIQLFRSPPKR